LNLGVSFYMAFRLALRAHNVTGLARAQVRAVIWRRWRHAPLSFFWPTRDAVGQSDPKG
jgi:site-specific recombinase